MNELPEGASLLLYDSHGIYIPQNFAGSFGCLWRVEGMSEEQWVILEAGPEHEWYWETWEEVLNNAVITNPTTHERFTLYQDGDLWLIPVDAEWPDPFVEDDLMDWDEQDARAAQEERLEAHRREQ